jgi:hypothetical protein
MTYERSRLEKVTHQLSQAWDMATTGKYSTWAYPIPMSDRISHIGHRLTDAVYCAFTGQTRVEAMYNAMADDMLQIEEEINRREKDPRKELPYNHNGHNGP